MASAMQLAITAAHLPSHQSAITCIASRPGRGGNDNLAVIHNAPTPTVLAPDEVLVRVAAIALNPCDWKMPDMFGPDVVGSIGGSDFAGIIVALGGAAGSEDRPGGRFSVGDRVSGAVHGFKPAPSATAGENVYDRGGGCFAEYVVATADILLKIPESVPWEDAAAIGGTGIATLGLAFNAYLHLGFTPSRPASAAETFPVLVYGAGTATGTMAIQLLKASGLRALAVCSSESAELALSYGAEKTFDYKSPNCAAEVKQYTNGRLNRILDIITDSSSVKLCYNAMGRLGGRYVGLEKIPDGRPEKQLVEADWIMGQSVFGKPLHLGGGYGRPAIPSHRDLGKRWFAEIQDLWWKQGIRPHPVKVERDMGLEGALGGIDLLRKGSVFRQKLVYIVKSDSG